jgi:pilus assembly protein CpaC
MKTFFARSTLRLTAASASIAFTAITPMLPISLLAQAKAFPAAAQSFSTASPAGQAASFTSSSTSEQLLHVSVGHSIFVNTHLRLRRVYVANPAILDSYTASTNQVVVTAKSPGVSSIILWDENGESKSYLISSDINVDALRTSMGTAFPHETIEVAGSEGKVILSGTVSTEELSNSAVKLASLYSKDVSNSLVINASHIKQVRLKVRIVEVDRAKLNQFGVNLLSAGGSTVAQSTTSQFPSTLSLSSGGSATSTGGITVGGNTLSISNPLNFLIYSSKLNIGATVQDLENKQVLQILAEPVITTISGQKASFLSGGEFPFPVVQGGTGGQTSVTIQFRSFGVKVDFLPIVNPDGTIELKVAPEVSALDYTNSVQIAGYTIPAISTRRADTQVVLNSGQSFAISGLLDRRTTDLLGRTPGISSIPLLGQLFRTKSINHTTSELIVIVTPTIVDPLTEQTLPAEPERVVPTLDPKKFDTSLPSGLKKP